MNFSISLTSLLWLLVSLLLLVFLQRALHREFQAAFLLLFRRPGLSQALFALVFFPGVLLHESGHFIAAKLLGVPTGRFSLIPQAQPDGRLRLGYVETASGGFVRDALIGVAPLAAGCLFVAYAAVYPMQLLPLWEFVRLAQWEALWGALGALPARSDFWLWFYLTFTVSSTMMPSASDRHAWLPLGLLAGGLVGVAVLAGAGPWMMEHLAPPLSRFLGALGLIFGLSGVIHILLIAPFLLLHRILVRLTGLEVG